VRARLPKYSTSGHFYSAPNVSPSVPSHIPFITPAQPRARSTPPQSEEWLHEVKFDGYRIQIHKRLADVVIFSKKGTVFTKRLPLIAEACRTLPVRSAIIDAEAFISDARGVSDLDAKGTPCAWCFDLIALDGDDIRRSPLIERKAKLANIFFKHDHPNLLYSEHFKDAHKLLSECERLGLEGIVSKRRNAPYKSRSLTDWVKVKTASWREANAERGDLFAK
jgi:bifunctional non-homologous end joining protein LigD